MKLLTVSKLILGCLVIVAVGSSCVVPQPAAPSNAMEVSRIRQLTERQARETGRLRGDLDSMREDLAKLQLQIEQSRETLNAVLRQMQQLETTLGAVDREATARAAANADSINTLKTALNTESRTREQAIKEVIASVSRELSAAINRLPAAGRVSGAGAGSASQGEYTVVRGDTLGAIASAFGVTVQSLKNANNLSDDRIFEGQKLIIPAR